MSRIFRQQYILNLFYLCLPQFILSFKLESRTVKIQELKKTLQDHHVETLPEQKTEDAGLAKKTKVSDIQEAGR